MRKTAIYLILLFTIISHSSFSNSNSIKFINAKNNGIRISQNSSLNLSSQGTIEAWIYLSSYKDFAGIIHKGDKKDFSDEAYTLQLWNNNKLYFAISNNSNSYQIQSTSSLQLSKWYHVSASWNSSGMQLYLNGKLESSSSNSLSINYASLNDPNKNGLNIGRQLNEDYNTSYNKFTFDGIIDEVRIWNSCLHIYQIQKRMFEELNSSDSLWSNLVGYWPFNEGSGTVVSDN
ncbi:MAG: LamG domain-containing protein, partial [Bacteroidetes bacterium]|nr:LamG domain-containing protein [Bacteroidota bacterium]MBT4729073.1 LamG domain-containing protein [Bacteroidota bacterium]